MEIYIVFNLHTCCAEYAITMTMAGLPSMAGYQHQKLNVCRKIFLTANNGNATVKYHSIIRMSELLYAISVWWKSRSEMDRQEELRWRSRAVQ